jgi:HK97 family phage prohead protease
MPETRESPAAPERRVVAIVGDLRVERRAAADGAGSPPRIVGHAAVFDRWAVLYEDDHYLIREVVRPGAYRHAIGEKQDVRSLFNHDSNFVLGRTVSGTLRLAEDAAGLWTETDPPDTPTIRDLVLAPIARGDVSGMSFAFTVRASGQTTTTEKDGVTVVDTGGDRTTFRREGDRYVHERELLAVDLYDVSPVTYPAYEQTDVALRSLAGLREWRSTHQEARGRRPRLALAAKRLRLFDAATPKSEA